MVAHAEDPRLTARERAPYWFLAACLACPTTLGCSAGSDTSAAHPPHDHAPSPSSEPAPQAASPEAEAPLAGTSDTSSRPEPSPSAADQPVPADTLELPVPSNECVLPSGSEIRLREGIPYTSTPGPARRLDLALPAGPGPHPFVLVIHGGAWRAGERAHVRREQTVLAEAGFAAAAVDYRLVDGRPGNLFPAQLADLRCAVRYLRRRASELGLAPRRGAALGYSAGAHLALLLGTTDGVAGLDTSCEDQETSVGLDAVVAFYAPTDLRDLDRYPRASAAVVRRLLGGSPSRVGERAALASPIAWVDGEDTPTLLLHGTDDPVVPVEDSRRMYRALQAAGVPSVFVEVPQARHGFRAFPTRSPPDAPGCTTLAFLRAALFRSSPGASRSAEDGESPP